MLLGDSISDSPKIEDTFEDIQQPEPVLAKPAAAPPTFLNLPQTQRPQMRVGFLTPSLGMGGAERWILSLSKHFRGAYTSAVGMISESYHVGLAEEMSRLAPVYSQHFIPGARRLGSVEEVVNTIIHQSDVILSWDIHTAEYLAGCSKPVVDVAHNDYDFPQQVEMAKKSWKGANVVAGVSRSCVEVYPTAVQKYGHVIYNGAEVDRATPRKGRALARQTWGIAEDTKVLLFIGRMSKQKQPMRLLNMLAKLPEDWIAIMVGHGDLRDQIEEQARGFTPGRVRFMPTSLHVGDFLAAADVFVLPSLNEGMPIVMTEAWIAGIPCVFSDFNCINELEEYHGSPMCWKVDKMAPTEQWVKAIWEAYREGRTSERVNFARSIAWNSYTATTMAYRWEKFLTWVVRHWHDLHTELYAVTDKEMKKPNEYGNLW